MKLKLIYVTALALAMSCSKSEDANPAASSNVGSASINGVAFTATDTKTTDTGNGLEIIMTSGDQVITLVTDDKKAGTYTIINASGRVQAGTSAIATYLKGTDTYLSKDGSIVITVDASGAISGTFTLNVKNAAGTTIAIGNGKLTALKAASLQVPAGKCLIASSVTTGQFGETFTPVYNSEGRHLKVIYSDTESYSYIWSNGVVVSSIYKSSNSLIREDWFYTSGKLTKTIRYDASDPLRTRTNTYTVNAAGQPTQVDFSLGGKWTYTYDGNGNCTSFNAGGSNTYTYSNYDNKPNPRTYLSAALGVAFIPGDEGGDAWSKNNVGTEVCTGCSPSTTTNYTYTYNAKGNVATITSSRGSIETFTYTGCN